MLIDLGPQNGPVGDQADGSELLYTKADARSKTLEDFTINQNQIHHASNL
jgi:hypothetical protein